jgi:ABC-type nickel/cobalt efflux system permease component RcnA
MIYPKEKFRSRLVTTFVQFASGRLHALKPGDAKTV